MDMTVTTEKIKTKSLFLLNEKGDLLFMSLELGAIKEIPLLCFPWMKNNEFISMRNDDGDEVYLIK
jgi:hypothetical protein